MSQEVVIKAAPKIKVEKSKPKKAKRYYDYSLIFALLFLFIFGLLMIYSASSYSAEVKFQDSAYFVKRQLIFGILGFAVMIGCSFINYKIWLKLSVFIYFVSTALAWLVWVIGSVRNGSRRWIEFGPISFQPSELVKIAIIILFASLLVRFQDKFHSEDKKTSRNYLFGLALLTAIPGAAVLFKNLSTGIIIFLIAFCMSFLGTDRRKFHIGGAVFMGIALLFTKPFISLIYKYGMNGYRMRRLMVWVEPEKFSRSGGYQVLQGLYAIGTGSVFGKGLGQGLQKFFLPESQNDMIFAIIVEETGLFGAAVIFAVFAFIIFRLLIIAYSTADTSAMYLVIGVIIHLSLQVILNIAVVTAVLPNTGVSLPFISYGGTSLLILFWEMSIVLSVARSIKLE